MKYLTEKHIEQLWIRMARIYGHKWVTNFGECDDGTWQARLEDLLPEELAAGVRRCIHSGDSWPPSLPEFRRLCLGLTDIGTAVHLAMTNSSSEPVIAKMREYVGAWECANLSSKELSQRFRSVYERSCSTVLTDRLNLSVEARRRLIPHK